MASGTSVDPSISRTCGSSETPLPTCQTCGNSFRRPEHLRRHMLSHLESKPFSCSECKKSFPRNDTLRRHELSHKFDNTDTGLESKIDISHRACVDCAAARVRCSRENPCRRCTAKSISCRYPNKRQKVSKRSQSDVTGASIHEPTEPSHSENTRTIEELQTVPDDVLSTVPAGSNLTDTTRGTPSTADNIPYVDHSHRYESSDMDYDDSVFSTSINWLPFNDMTYSAFDFSTAQMMSTLLPDARQDCQISMTSQVHQISPYETIDKSRRLQPPSDGQSLARQTTTETEATDSSPIPSSDFSSTSNISSTALYVDGAGSRDTKYRELPVGALSVFLGRKAQRVGHQNGAYAFTHMEDMVTSIPERAIRPSLTLSAYQEILAHFRILCLGPGLLFPAFASQYLPSREVLDACIKLYFAHFHIAFPLIHEPSFLKNADDWMLVLAVAAIGATFSDLENQSGFLEAFHEFLRRAILLASEVSGGSDQPSGIKTLAQASLLNVVGMSQLNNPKLYSLATSCLAALVTLSRKHGFMNADSIRKGRGSNNTEWSSLNKNWKQWVREEEHRRIGFLTWLVDSTLAFQQCVSPCLSLADAQARLPCHEVLWQAQSEKIWLELGQKHCNPPTISAIMPGLYSGTHVDLDLGELSHVLLIHAICRRTREIGEQVREPLSNVHPAAKTNIANGVKRPEEGTRWLPAVPTYANWRNSACDCLDTLHWHSHTIVAKNSGLEHHAVLHLHLARIVLLTPHQEIRDLVSASIEQHRPDHFDVLMRQASQTAIFPTPTFEESVSAIWLWLSQDQHKARLSLIHAGTLFWHIRRYSVNSFYEPTAMFLATLVLWTYSSYNSVVSSSIGRRENNTESYSAGDGTMNPHTVDRAADAAPKSPHFIQIDRPCDDEMVQLFVRKGDSMQINLNGVGNISEPGAARGVLKEGARLLGLRCSSWEITQKYHDVLLILANTV